jgi:hypothetical protein
MARVETVIFRLWDREGRFEQLYDRTRLKLGSPVYVRFSDQNQPTEFSAEKAVGTVPYWVHWTSEWSVVLVPQYELRPEFAKRLHNELEGYLSSHEIDGVIKTFVGRVKMELFYRTDEMENNPLNIAFTVADRLSVCRRLREHSPIPHEIASHFDDPLVSYLYLTCFDRLGQPHDWEPFANWMESSRHKAERDAILH